MISDKSRITGFVRAQVFGPDGKIKRFPQSWWRKLLGIPGKPMISEVHNIVTDEGDALVADIMSNTPARTKVDNSNGYIQVGTGWTGTSPKTNQVLNAATGSPKGMEATYPKQKGAFGAANDNVTQYRVIFTAGLLNASGINEAIIFNNVTPASADSLAYGQITPSVNVTTVDTLQIDWELTYLGA